MMWRWSLFRFHSLGPLVAGVFIQIIFAHPCPAGVVINEVYYDHPGRDDGWEFIELFNPDAVPCALSGWVLEAVDGTAGKGKVVWTASPDALIGPGEFLCIAGIERAPSPECLLKGTLGNGPDAVRLVSSSGIVDLVGYGPCVSGDLYETVPAPDVPAGTSLARKPDGFDGDRNDTDFVPASPTPGRRNFFRFDVGIRLVGENVLPCRGASFPLKLMIVNRGLEPIDGRVSILTEVRESGFTASSGELNRTLDLAASAADSIELTPAAPESPRFEVRAYLDGALDDNPANDTTCVSLGASPGAILVNEIMY
ncbi:MAG: lamin tail domain-containing protein, partial [Candidatus Krumholzibacteria bacterium]|nr:lamin tail domain-containing protein [Candidatus Krumholzibacteria bacterium]